MPDIRDLVPTHVADAMYEYAGKVYFVFTDRLAMLVLKSQSEVAKGLRGGSDFSEGPPTFARIAQRSDLTERPLFPEEIRDFIKTLRFTFSFPYEVVKDVVIYGERLEDQLTMEEFGALCLWVDDLTPGAGLSLFDGPLKFNK